MGVELGDWLAKVDAESILCGHFVESFVSVRE